MPDALAGELALGLLDGEVRARALRRVLADPGFARAVEDWHERLAPLLDEIAEAAPAPALWARIEAALDAGVTGDAGVVVAMRRWRRVAIAALAATAALLGLLLVRPAPIAPTAAPPMLVAQLSSEETHAVLLATYDAARGRLRVSPATLAAAGRSPELWVIPAGGSPRSLGLIEASTPTEMAPAAAGALLVAGASLAVSLEPAGGSPTGQPTGPVVAAGKLQTL